MASLLSFFTQALDSLINAGNGLNKGCRIVLSCGGDSVTFPVIPGSFEVENPYNNSTVNINSLGEINMLGKRGLSTLKFSSIFPAQSYYWLDTTPEAPYSYVDKIKSFAEKGQPCKITISNTNISMNVSIESFNFTEKDGTSDIYFTLALREYRYIMPQSEKLNETTGLQSRVAETVEEKNINWYPGMDLMDVAAQSVGQFVPINEQGTRQLAIFKSLVVNKNFNVGSMLNATKQRIKLNDDTFINF